MRGVAIAFLLYLLSHCSFSIAGDSLTPAQPLLDDDGSGNLVSSGGRFELGFFSPAGTQNRYVGIWYHNISGKAVVWVANRQRPINGLSGRLSLAANGTLVVTDDNSTLFWSSSSSYSNSGAYSPVARLRNDGNLVISDGRNSDSVSWQSFDFPTDTFLSGMIFGKNDSSGRNVNITSWASPGDPAPGSCVLGIDLSGVPQEFLWDGSEQPVGRLGPWNGVFLGGVPTINFQVLIDYHFVLTSREFIYWYTVRDPSVLVRITVSQQGTGQVLMWVEGSQSWTPQNSFPMDPCDRYARCGPNGVCDPNGSSICRCLPGFRPKKPRNWGVWEWTDGCVRKTELDCSNATDDFFTFSNVKLPDTSRSTVDWSTRNLDDCRASCLRNCSCTAYARANISGGGSGCIFWTANLTDIKLYNNGFGEDLYLRLARADIESLSSGHGNKRRVAAIIVAVLLAGFLLAAAVSFLWRRRKTRNNKTKHRSDEDEGVEEGNLDMPLFDLDTIAEATGDFCVDNKLGEGGFGPVYKGKLEEGQEIAVKRLSKTSTQGTDEFKNEVMVIAKLQHRNLVRLLGCCVQGGERMLIYEYMLNGSLDTFLFDKADRCRLLDWRMRQNIILGIARGLLYLHHDSRYRIIHRDLKTSNILLDKDMNPKISDFGMAKLFGGDETTGNTKRVAGTYGYMSPEYAMNGIFSVKSDVFSFGVLVLEILTGEKNNGAYHSNLLGKVWCLWKEDRALEIVDDFIHDSFPLDEVLRCIKVGLLCVQERPEDRPEISTVLLMLGSNSSSLPEPKQPGFAVTGDQIDTDSLSSKVALLSINRLSVTMVEGR